MVVAQNLVGESIEFRRQQAGDRERPEQRREKLVGIDQRGSAVDPDTDGAGVDLAGVTGSASEADEGVPGFRIDVLGETNRKPVRVMVASLARQKAEAREVLRRGERLPIIGLF